MEISFYLPEYWLGVTTGCVGSLILVIATFILAAVVSIRSDKKKAESEKK